MLLSYLCLHNFYCSSLELPVTNACFITVRWQRGLFSIFKCCFSCFYVVDKSAQLPKKSIVLNMENKMLYSRVQFNQIIERAGQGNRNWKLVIKISADLNRNRFLFQCQVHVNASKKLELTGLLLLVKPLLKLQNQKYKVSLGSAHSIMFQADFTFIFYIFMVCILFMLKELILREERKTSTQYVVPDV